jgi:hypothetical protein
MAVSPASSVFCDAAKFQLKKKKKKKKKTYVPIENVLPERDPVLPIARTSPDL